MNLKDKIRKAKILYQISNINIEKSKLIEPQECIISKKLDIEYKQKVFLFHLIKNK